MRIRLPGPAHDALVDLARGERRDVASEIECIVIAALHARGLVSADGTQRTVPAKAAT